MKTDEEIKEWIDSREALTKFELTKFIHPHWKPNSQRKASNQSIKVLKWWDYVLKTKSWELLKEYRKLRRGTGLFKEERFNNFYEIYKKDKRIKEFGRTKAQRLLKNMYGLDITPHAVNIYKNRIKRVEKFQQKRELCTQKNN